MTHVSIELVPRSADSLSTDLRTVREKLPAVRMVNIPDLLDFELRSWDACRQALGAMARAVPHVRAMDFDLDRRLGILVNALRTANLREVLVVQGDPPQDLHHPVFPTKSVDLIRAPPRRCLR
jgi:methylenetetrahydrofolate reductase (NADPH)